MVLHVARGKIFFLESFISGRDEPVYRKRTNFHGYNISWVKLSRGLILVGKSSPL